MSEPTRIFFTGNSLEQAVMAAAQHHGVEPDDVAFERVERRYGILRLRRNVVIKVDPEHPTTKRSQAPEPSANVVTPGRDEPPVDLPETQSDFNLDAGAPRSGERSVGQGASPEKPSREAAVGGERRAGGRPSSSGESEPADPTELLPARNLARAEGEAAAAAAAATRKLASIAGLEIEVDVFQGERELEVELSGPDQGLLVEGEGRLLLAIQHLLPRVLRSASGEMGSCRVDSQRFRERRVNRLERLARRTAEDVRRENRAETLHAMNPADRRTIHLALKNEDDVVTESTGQGFYKRVTIRPV